MDDGAVVPVAVSQGGDRAAVREWMTGRHKDGPTVGQDEANDQRRP